MKKMAAPKKKGNKTAKAAVRPRNAKVQLDMFGEIAPPKRRAAPPTAPAGGKKAAPKPARPEPMLVPVEAPVDRAGSTAVLTIVDEEGPVAAQDTPPRPEEKGGKAAPLRRDAASLATRQREISVSEFFTKNRHLLGFDNPQKALLTAVKEAVDNSFDACEEAGILPDIAVEVVQIADNRFRIAVQDNGPGIVKAQIPKILGKLLYGSKFHRIKQSRGQQGIGISAAGMYGQLTTGKPMCVTSRIGNGQPAHYYEIQIDTRKNAPIIVTDREVAWAPEHGTRVEIELEAVYKKGRRSVDDFIDQTALANPHATVRYAVTGEEPRLFERVTDEMPKEPLEIKPHPYGVELGMLMRMLAETQGKTVRQFLARDFSRMSPRLADAICEKAGVPADMRPIKVLPGQAELLFRAINDTKFMAPPTNCLSPIGKELVLEGLRKQFKADVYFGVSRPPSVYRGNPFQVECGVAFGGDLPAEEPVTLFRFANRVPLLYQQSACAVAKSVIATSWKSYHMQQPRGALPVGPMVLLVHIASVWVPFTSESKEAIAAYPEIIREIRLALMECGRQVSAHIRKHAREADAMKKIGYIEKYIPHIGIALKEMLKLNDKQEGRVVDTLKDTLQKSRMKTV